MKSFQPWKLTEFCNPMREKTKQLSLVWMCQSDKRCAATMWSYKTSPAFIQHHFTGYGGLITLQGLISAARDPVSTSVWIVHVALLSLQQHPFLKPPPCDLPPPTRTFPSDSRYKSTTSRPPRAEKLQAQSLVIIIISIVVILFWYFYKNLSRRLPSIPPQDVWKQDEGAGEGALPQDLQRVRAQAAAEGDEWARGESSEEHPAAWGPGDLTKKKKTPKNNTAE